MMNGDNGQAQEQPPTPEPERPAYRPEPGERTQATTDFL